MEEEEEEQEVEEEEETRHQRWFIEGGGGGRLVWDCDTNVYISNKSWVALPPARRVGITGPTVTDWQELQPNYYFKTET